MHKKCSLSIDLKHISLEFETKFIVISRKVDRNVNLKAYETILTVLNLNHCAITGQ